MAVAEFVAAVNGATLQQIPFFVSMAEGDSVEIAEHGPFTFSAACDSSAVSIRKFIRGFIVLRFSCMFTSCFDLRACHGNLFCRGLDSVALLFILPSNIKSNLSL